MASEQSAQTRAALIAQLREQLHAVAPPCQGTVSSGLPALDQQLPGGGFARGTLVEWLTPQAGGGAGSLALLAACQACRGGEPLVVVDAAGRFYPPAAVARGLAAERLIVVRPRRPADEIWALDQALRSRGIGAVLAWFERGNQRAWRRWQLAAEQSAGLGLFVRPSQARDEPCWAAVRLLVHACPSLGARRLRIELVRCRGMSPGSLIDVEFDHEPCAVHLSATDASAPQPAAELRRWG